MTAIKKSPDDLCEVCSEIRENHGDKKHEFSQDGQLIPVRAGEAPRNQPPKETGHRALTSEDPVVRLNLRLIQVLVAKKLLDGDDLFIIFGGTSASD